MTRLQTPNKQKHSDRVNSKPSYSRLEASLCPPYRSDQTVGNGIGHDIHPIGASHDDEPDFGTSCNETVDTTFAQTEARPQQMSHGGDYK